MAIDNLLNVKMGIFEFTVDEETARELIADRIFLSEALLLILDRETVYNCWDIALGIEGLRERLEKHYERTGWSMDFINPILDKLPKE